MVKFIDTLDSSHPPALRNPRPSSAPVIAAERLREMEVLLRWEGELDNARLREVFGVQTVQASRMLSGFIAAYGDRIRRASPHAPVVPGDGFALHVPGSSPDEYLRLVRQLPSSPLSFGVEDLRLDLAPVSPVLFALAVQACRRQTGLMIHYRSLQHPEGQQRLVFPHRLVRAARRWHIRAWCALREEFRDFAIGRMSDAASVPSVSPCPADQDLLWNTWARLEVVAHPKLASAHARLVQDEYLGGESVRLVHVRRCLLGYTVQDLRLATDTARQKPPSYQLHLRNAAEFADDFAILRAQ